MAVKSACLRASDEIVANLQSTATVSTRTVDNLRVVLETHVTVADAENCTKSRSIAKPSKESNRTVKPHTSTSVARTKTPTHSETCLSHDLTPNSISSLEKRNLAVEVFNAALKRLSKLIKERKSTGLDPRASHKKPEVPHAKSVPLRPSSPNKPIKSKDGACHDGNSLRNAQPVVDCAVMAMNYLHAIDSQDSTNGSQQQVLEKGGLVLLEKLITLGLHQDARTESAKLYTHFQEKRTDNQQSTSRQKDTESNSLDHLDVRFPTKSLSESDFGFVSSYQSQLLRLAIQLGSSVVTEKFVTDIMMKSEGSPFDIVSTGVENRFLSNEQAGQQIRTISQALLTLYASSIAERAHRTEKAKLNFIMLSEALKAKCQSWKLIGHRPDLTRELWPHFLKGLKRLETDMRNQDWDMVELVTSSLRHICISLDQNGFESIVPFDLVNAVIDTAEAIHNDGKLWPLIQDLSRNVHPWPAEHKVIFLWRQVAIRYRLNVSQDSQMLHLMEEASKSFLSLHNTSVDLGDNLLLHGVRLRKVAVALVRDMQQCLTSHATGLSTEMFENCLQILVGFCMFCARLMQAPKSQKQLSKHSAPLKGFAKTLEAVFELRKLVPIVSLPFTNQCNDQFLICLDTAKKLIKEVTWTEADEPTIAFVENLMIQTSNFYWLLYLEQASHDSSQDVSLEALNHSCDTIRDVSTKVQLVGCLGMKLEKLATVYLTTKRAKAACRCFEDAAAHYTALNALNQVGESALLGSSRSIWSQGGKQSCSLERVLRSLTKLYLTYGLESPTTNTWIYNNPNVEAVQQILLFQVQISVIDDHPFSDVQGRAFERHCVHLLQICDDPLLAIFRARFFSQILRVASRNSSLWEWTTSLAKHYVSIIGALCDGDSTAPFKSCAQSLMHLIQIQWIMRFRPSSIDDLCTHLKGLTAAITGCMDLESLLSSVDDPDAMVGQLHAVTDIGRMLDRMDITMLSLRSIKHILMLTDSSNSSRIVDTWTQLGRLYHRAGDAVQASKAYTAAEQLLDGAAEAMPIRGSQWALAYAEYLTEHSDMAKALELFARARAFAEVQKSSQSSLGRQRYEQHSLVCRSAHVASSMALHCGHLALASHLARQSVKIGSEIWLAMEKSRNEDASNSVPGQDVSSNDNTTLVMEMSGLTLSSDDSLAQVKPKGSAYWDHVDLYCSTLGQMIDLSMHNGLFQDALYYAEQLKKVATATGSKIRQHRAFASLALIHTQAGQMKEAALYLRSTIYLSISYSDLSDRFHALQIAEAFVEADNLTDAQSILDKLERPPASTAPDSSSGEAAKTGLLKTSVRRGKKAPRTIDAAAKRPGRSAPPKNQITQSGPPNSSFTRKELYILQKCKSLRDQISVLQNRPTNWTASSSADVAITPYGKIVSVTSAKAMLSQAMTELSTDAVKCVLAETALALPVKYKSNRKSGRVSFIEARDDPNDKKRSKRANLNSATTQNSVPHTHQLSPAEQLIFDAQKRLRGCWDDQTQWCPSDMVHLGYKVQSRLALLSSAMNVPFTTSSSELVLQSLTPKDIVQDRDRIHIRAERALRIQSEILSWPDLTDLQESKPVDGCSNPSLADLVDMPDSWTIVSISLADNNKELLMSKIMKNKSPFLIRIPLSRSDLELDEGEEFSFVAAKDELDDIVSRANASARDPRGQGDREMRKAWYAEREELDRRLRSWLYNIENIWLGGFRGIMSSQAMDDEVLNSFEESLIQILNRHLPSRQKSATHKLPKVTLHSHVLELFLGIGHPDNGELDDAVLDLLYFVVDILQFSGENNAYDEIDFDAMLVDVLDAMRSSHQVQDATSSPKHTILVVDKELASFPWESLPCLEKHSVSRMPSLKSIVERLQHLRSQSLSAQGYTIPAGQGTCILNPSSDLTSTRATFEPIIQSQLPTFTTISNTPPTEAEFVSQLTESTLFLYFGHGSGAQYIRGRTIRALDSCAVTLLMGCSSAQMTERGKFESHGMPGYYMGGLNGCMALVGTLWDVTDRDIDRFAVKMLVEWGLIDGADDNVRQTLEKSSKKIAKKDARHAQSGQKTRSMARVEAENQTMEIKQRKRGLVSLDHAVSEARDACLLRYLNGAAPVVYGVPVFLE